MELSKAPLRGVPATALELWGIILGGSGLHFRSILGVWALLAARCCLGCITPQEIENHPKKNPKPSPNRPQKRTEILPKSTPKRSPEGVPRGFRKRSEKMPRFMVPREPLGRVLERLGRHKRSPKSIQKRYKNLSIF